MGETPICPPRLVDGVVETYTTKYPTLTAPFLPAGQKEPHPVFKILPLSVRERLHTRNMNRALFTAIERESFVHMWTHLWETANDVQWPQLENFLRKVSTATDSGTLHIRTMKELNREVRDL